MGPNQTYKLLYSKGNHKQNEKTPYKMEGKSAYMISSRLQSEMKAMGKK